MREEKRGGEGRLREPTKKKESKNAEHRMHTPGTHTHTLIQQRTSERRRSKKTNNKKTKQSKQTRATSKRRGSSHIQQHTTNSTHTLSLSKLVTAIHMYREKYMPKNTNILEQQAIEERGEDREMPKKRTIEG